MEVEELKAKLAESNNCLLRYQRESSVAHEALLQENSKLQDDFNKLRDRYERCYFNFDLFYAALFSFLWSFISFTFKCFIDLLICLLMFEQVTG